MITPLFLSFLVMQPAASQQGEQGIQQLQRQVSELRQTVEQMYKLMQNDPNIVCAAEVRWQPGSVPKSVDIQKPIALSLFSVVSAPADGCLNADLRITATYYRENGAFVCSGAVSTVLSGNVQNTLFEFQPFNLEFFAKWRDGPTWDRSNFHRLNCYDYDGLENHEPGAHASVLKLFATVLPKRGGIATAELTLGLPAPIPTTNPR